MSEAAFSKRRVRLVLNPLNDDNPVTIQVLGICSALAVTVQLKPTFIMAVAVTFVIVFSNLIYSMIRNLVPGRIRIIVQLAVIATFVILVDQILKAYAYEMSKQLSVFIGLIITNCIVMGRLEAFAGSNKPYDSVLDGFGSGFGYSWIILAVAVGREIFGSGSFFGFKVFDYFFDIDPETGEGIGVLNEAFGTTWEYTANGLMVNPIGAFMLLGIIIWVQRTKSGYVED